MLFLDTETCGLHGVIVLIQWAKDNGPIKTHNVWFESIQSTKELIYEIVSSDVCGFNLVFDWFHICKLYTILIQAPDPSLPLIAYKKEAPIWEERGRHLDICLKPKGALDLMLHARKGPYQSTMNRKDIVIKRVPTKLAPLLAHTLNERIPLKNIYFDRKSDSSKRWEIRDILDDLGDVNPDFKNLDLKFAPSSALKALYVDITGDTSATQFAEIQPPGKPNELGYAPYAAAIGNPPYYNKAWQIFIQSHAMHWDTDEQALDYAKNDIEYLRVLYDAFDKPEVNDDDSVIACMVGATRWRGFRINIEKLKVLKEKAKKRLEASPYNFNSTAVAKKYLYEVMSETEKLGVKVDGKLTTKGTILEEVLRWRISDICPDCDGLGCEKCHEEGLIDTDEIHPAAKRARKILDYRHSYKEIELYNKLIKAKRFHASFVVIGTKSNRLSGADGLNAQGIKHATYVQECFELAEEEEILCGGDYDGSQVKIADAVFADPKLHRQLLDGKKVYPIFGEYLFPGKTYDDIVATKGLPNERDLYDRSKKGFLAMLFGGEVYTLQQRVGISEIGATEAYSNWCRDYTKWAAERRRYFNLFCSMRQPNGIGTPVHWNEPADYIASMFGFRRYFTLENKICKVLYDLASDPPKEWKKINIKVIRRDREQTATGAVRSALFAAAFALQAANMRAAANHVIQSPEATIMKNLQCCLWELQPTGITEWKIRLLNVHDELQSACKPEIVTKSSRIVADHTERMRKHIPLIKMDWKTNLSNWADK